MPTLAQTIKQNNKVLRRGPGGQLTEETPEEIQTLSGQAGLQAPPTTPLGGAMIGANKDQQKMMGTPQQKEAALSLATEKPDATLQDAMRRKQVRSQATGQEQQAIQKSQDMENLGTLGDRVNDFINTQRQTLQEKAGTGVEVQAVDQFQGKDTSTLKELLSNLRNNPSDQNIMLQVNQALGYDVNRQLAPAEVDDLYESAIQSISRGASGSVDDDLNVDDLVNMQSFGYDKKQMSDLLGVPEDQLSKMTVAQLRNEIDRVGTEEFSKTQGLEQQAQSGQLGQAERGLARDLARESSRVGTRASEADFSNLEGQIANADKVQFGGKEYQVDELLQDDTISGIISDYMNSAPGSETRNQIDQKEPALRDFIQKNQAVLADASQQLQTGAKTFQDTQSYNQSLQNFGGIKLSDELMGNLVQGFGNLRAEKIDPNSVPVLKAAQEGGPDYSRQMANNLNSELQNDKSNFSNELKGLDYNTIKSWDIGNADPNSNWNSNYIQPKRFWEQVSTLPPQDADRLIKMALTDVTNKDDAQGKMSSNRSANVLGFGSKVNTGVIDSNGDGIIDSGQDIKEALLKANPRPSLANGPSAVQKYTPGAMGKPQIPDSGLDHDIYNKLKGDALKGSINYGDLVNNKINLEEAIRLQDMKGQGNVSGGDVDRFHSELRSQNTGGVLKDISNQPLSRTDKINALDQEMQKQGDRRLDKGQVDAEKKRLADEELNDILAHAAEDRDRTRTRVRQQKQIISIAVPAFAAMPPQVQDALMDGMTAAGQAGLDEIKKIDWDSNRTMPENLAILGRQVYSAPFRAALEGVSAGLKSVGEATPGYTGQVAGKVGSSVSKATDSVSGLCFISGTKFLMDDGSLLNVEDLQPGDCMGIGGTVLFTHSGPSDRIYKYKDVFVTGDHPVLDIDGVWKRVRDCINIESMPGEYQVYSVTNTGHMMISESRIVFGDYELDDILGL